jgi:hypothetical protein
MHLPGISECWLRLDSLVAQSIEGMYWIVQFSQKVPDIELIVLQMADRSNGSSRGGQMIRAVVIKRLQSKYKMSLLKWRPGLLLDQTLPIENRHKAHIAKLHCSCTLCGIL